MTNALKNKKLGIIGAGNMGEALIRGLVRSKALKPSQISIFDVDEKKCASIAIKYKIKKADSNEGLTKDSDIFIIAVKPQNIDLVLHELAVEMNARKLAISIAAGVRTSRIESHFKKGCPVIRVMPNTPALVGEAISSVTGGRFAKAHHLEIADAIFRSVGEVVYIKDEGLIDLVTAISGSGPAYFFYLIESLIDAAVELGMKEDVALSLVSQTALGSAKLLKQTGHSVVELRRRVTSKGGTTEAALKVLEEHEIKGIIEKAIRAALKRSKELSR